MVVVGLLAGTLTTACWIPQVVRTFRLRNADAFAWSYLAMFTTGVTLWLIYGIARDDVAIELANGLTLLLILGVAVLKALQARPVSADRTHAAARRDRA